jgi:hypothetical protein
MTSSADLRVVDLVVSVVLVCGMLVITGANSHVAEAKADGKVGIVFFGAKDCPSCVHVKEVLRVLAEQYRLEIKAFDTGKSQDNALLDRLEQIHGEGKFSIPLVMVGDSILQGEREIGDKLEGTVRRLAISGGSPLPYLGPSGESKRIRQDQASSRCDCKSGGPPTVGEEFEKLKGLLRRLF